jgi:hypothetical protein
MECPSCQSKVGFRDVARERCPTCASKIYWSDKWRWLRGLSCLLLTILLIGHWFPREADLGEFLLWLVALVFVFYAVFIASGFIIPPDVSLVPERGPIRLDIERVFIACGYLAWNSLKDPGGILVPPCIINP